MLHQVLSSSPAKRHPARAYARWAAWVTGSVAVHALAIAALAAALPVTRRVSSIPVEVTFVKGTPVPAETATFPPAPPPARALASSAPRHRAAQTKARVRLARATPPADEAAAVPAPAPVPTAVAGAAVAPGGGDEAGAGVDGVDGGVQGGVPGGIAGGTLSAGPGPIAFNPASMTPPAYVSGPAPHYTRRAMDREVEGTMMVRCTVGVDGTVRGCEVLQGLPYLDESVVDALQARRYRPATREGTPVEVKYVFRLHMKMPR